MRKLQDKVIHSTFPNLAPFSSSKIHPTKPQKSPTQTPISTNSNPISTNSNPISTNSNPHFHQLKPHFHPKITHSNPMPTQLPLENNLFHSRKSPRQPPKTIRIPHENHEFHSKMILLQSKTPLSRQTKTTPRTKNTPYPAVFFNNSFIYLYLYVYV